MLLKVISARCCGDHKLGELQVAEWDSSGAIETFKGDTAGLQELKQRKSQDMFVWQVYRNLPNNPSHSRPLGPSRGISSRAASTLEAITVRAAVIGRNMADTQQLLLQAAGAAVQEHQVGAVAPRRVLRCPSDCAARSSGGRCGPLTAADSAGF
jgi:hypothetical protein